MREQLLVSIFCVTAAGGTAFAQGRTAEPGPTGSTRAIAAESAANWAVASEEVADNLQRARADLERGRRASASEQLDRAAAILRLGAAGAPTGERTNFENAARELTDTSRRVSAATERAGRTFDQGIARVSHGLAAYHLANARQSWVGREAKLTGREMHAATTHLENAARWSGATAERAGREITSDTLRLSERLVRGAAAVPEDVGRSIDRLGGEVDRIGREMTTPLRAP
jgi:hypothetical protein